MSHTLRGARVLLVLTLLLSLAACDTTLGPQVESALTSEVRPDAEGSLDAMLKAVRQATARFHSTTQAIRAGYAPDDHCVVVPGLGGMGYHWANFDLVDPVFEPLRPEVLLYATGPGGNLRLVAVEYIVLAPGAAELEDPLPYLEGPDRPSFGGHLFDIGGTPVPFPHWSLHVWLYEDNPNGLFTPFNPNVSCP
jgi:hypothetical protein